MREGQESANVTNELLLDMVKNQRKTMSDFVRVFVIVVICYTAILVSMIIGFFVYESQFETTETTTTTETIVQEVDGENSSINNIDGNQYNDNAIHNE